MPLLSARRAFSLKSICFAILIVYESNVRLRNNVVLDSVYFYRLIPRFFKVHAVAYFDPHGHILAFVIPAAGAHRYNLALLGLFFGTVGEDNAETGYHTLLQPHRFN